MMENGRPPLPCLPSDCELVARAMQAFAGDIRTPPSISLRGGNALDEYSVAPPFDPAIDDYSAAYFERYWWGIAHLDPPSWRHYLPFLMQYALEHRADGDMVIDSLLMALRPPDRDPPRLASLNAEQEAVVAQFLESLAFGEPCPFQEMACQVVEEWWVPGALYRPVPNEVDQTDSGNKQ